MSFGDNNGIQFLPSIGHSCGTRDPEESYLYQDTLSFTHGKHSLKFGGSYLRYRSNDYEPGNISGSFAFNNLETSLPGFVTTTGHPFASFLMGAAHSASDSIYTTEPGYRQAVMSFFAQDDWRATSKLTLNLGVRWEIPTPRTEAFNRMAQFDPTASDPLPSGATVPGALVWLGHCSGCVSGTNFQNYYFKEFAPRLGVAYQVNNKLVLRGGYGISYQPPTQGGWGARAVLRVQLRRGSSAAGRRLTQGESGHVPLQFLEWVGARPGGHACIYRHVAEHGSRHHEWAGGRLLPRQFPGHALYPELERRLPVPTPESDRP